MILDLCFYNDPVLRQKAKPIESITSEIRDLAANMLETCTAENGLGLAAPQVGYSLRMFIFRPLQDDHHEPKPGFPLVVINPKLSQPSKEQWVSPEGCLSIPKIYGEVERPLKINLEAIDLDGNPISLELEGMDARIAMHENDHLNGVLFIDRMNKKERRKLESALRRLDKK